MQLKHLILTAEEGKLNPDRCSSRAATPEHTFREAGQAPPELLLKHAVQGLQIAAVISTEEVAALSSEHAPKAAALHPTESLSCCQNTLSPL